jgi:sulfate adenylyltransferase
VASDRKGLYARARAGVIPKFTWISVAYEPPPDAAITVDTRTTSVEDACTLIVGALTSRGYLVPS